MYLDKILLSKKFISKLLFH